MTATGTPSAPGDAGGDSPVGRVVTASLERIRFPKKRSGHVLLMLSGGLDSVALLANLLSATDLDVHAHHIVLDNREQRAEAESGVLQPILDTCRDRYRPFETSESVHGFHLPGGGWDTMVTMFTAARASRALGKWPVDVVVTGHINPSFKELAEGESVFHAAHQSRRWRPEWVRPLAWLRGTRAERKADIYDSLPPDLAEAVWYCRRPVVDEETGERRRCDTCHSCTLMVEAHAVRAARAESSGEPDTGDGKPGGRKETT